MEQGAAPASAAFQVGMAKAPPPSAKEAMAAEAGETPLLLADHASGDAVALAEQKPAAMLEAHACAPAAVGGWPMPTLPVAKEPLQPQRPQGQPQPQPHEETAPITAFSRPGYVGRPGYVTKVCSVADTQSERCLRVVPVPRDTHSSARVHTLSLQSYRRRLPRIFPSSLLINTQRSEALFKNHYSKEREQAILSAAAAADEQQQQRRGARRLHQAAAGSSGSNEPAAAAAAAAADAAAAAAAAAAATAAAPSSTGENMAAHHQHGPQQPLVNGVCYLAQSDKACTFAPTERPRRTT